jgi:hypothetical protein
MSSYLQQHNQRLDARSRSIEGRESPAGYTRFLEDQIARLGKREADFDKMQAKIVDLQTSVDRLLNRDARQDSDASGRLKVFAKLEDRLAAVETSASKVEAIEKQGIQRFVCKRPLPAFEAKVNARLNKIEKELDHLPLRLREQWQIDLQEMGHYLDSTLRQEKAKSPPATAVKDKDKKKAGKNLRFRGQDGSGLESHPRFEVMREEFNVKLQSLIEEVQNTVTLKEFEKKCQYFEERIGVLKGMIPPAVTYTPVLNANEPSVKVEDGVVRNLVRRLGFVEEGIGQLKSTVENLFSLVQREKPNKKETHQYLQLEEDLTPINPPGKGIFIKTRPKYESFEGHNFLNIDEIENFDIFDGQSSHRSIAQKAETTDRFAKPRQSKPKPASKVSSSTGKIGTTGSKPKPVSASHLQTLKDKSQHIRDEGANGGRDLRESQTTMNNKEKIKALLSKQGGSSKKAN